MKNQRLIGLVPEMAKLDQWVCYDLTEIREDGKGKKTPKYFDGRKICYASSTNPLTWMSFDKAVEICKNFKLTGIGFVFTESDPFIGIDLDKCRDPKTGVIETWAQDIIDWLASYTEITPSGLGFHIIVKGKIGRALKQDQLEIYSTARFFTMTGNAVGEDFLDIKDCTQQLQDLIEFIRPKEERGATKQHSYNPEHNNTDDYSTAELCLKRLSSWRCDDHGDWLAVGMSLRSLGQNGFHLWDNWSKGSHKYNARECEKRWKSFSRGGNSAGTITLGSLVYWANHDDPGGKQRKAYKNYNITETKATLSQLNDEPIITNNPPDEPESVFTDTAPAENIALTDMGNAQRLVKLYGENIKYCFVWKKWLVWDGKKWIADDLGVVADYAEKTIKTIYKEAAEQSTLDEANQVGKWAKKSQDNQRVKALIERARNQETIPILPNQFDTNPWLLNCQNGTVDLKTGKLHYHKKIDLLMKSTSTEYYPQADCPTWLGFLSRIMSNNKNLINFLQRAIGHSLTGNTMEKALFFLYGALGDNGKSTFLETISRLMGTYALAKFPVNALIDDPGNSNNNASANVAQLAGVRFVSCSEIGKGKKLNEELVKDLTGGIDTISAKRLYENPFTFEPTHKLFMYGNNKPLIDSTSNSVWKRLKLIPFLVSIPEAEQDKQLPDKLQKELPGILTWAIQGCLLWQQEGLEVPDEVKEAVNHYRSEMDALAGFLEDCCLAEQDLKCSAKALFEAYEKWCEENGEKVYSQKFFGSQLTAKGFERYKGTGGYYWWRGIGLITGNIS